MILQPILALPLIAMSFFSTEGEDGLYAYAFGCFRKAALLLPDDSKINEHLIIAQAKLDPAFCVCWIEPTSTSNFRLMNTTGAAVEVEAYLPLSELCLPLLPGVHVNILPRPAGWPRRPAGGFADDSEGFLDYDATSRSH